MNSPIYKIKDSVDLFLSDDRYLMVYFINTRLRKSFKVNEWTVHLLETIDGKRKLSESVILQNLSFQSARVGLCVFFALRQVRYTTLFVISKQ